jgi:hypothetical protein
METEPNREGESVMAKRLRLALRIILGRVNITQVDTVVDTGNGTEWVTIVSPSYDHTQDFFVAYGLDEDDAIRTRTVHVWEG